MPFTPFHFGPSACLALPFKKYLDLPAFVLANVIVDLEPLFVILFGIEIYPLHGYCHTFLFGSFIGFLWGILAFSLRKYFHFFMSEIRLHYDTNFLKIVISSILGIWFHILLDAPLYSDIKPFYPIIKNPLYGLISTEEIYIYCLLSFIPAFIFYLLIAFSSRAATGLLRNHLKPHQK